MTSVTASDASSEQAISFQAYANLIGMSRPYVSKLVAEGRISGRAMTADRKIIPSLADADRAAMADPARATREVPVAHEATYARQKARKAAADAETAEINLRQLKGELIERSTVAQILSPWLRQLRDDVMGVPRDKVIDPVSAADCEAELAAVLEAFSAKLAGLAAESKPHGDPAPATG